MTTANVPKSEVTKVVRVWCRHVSEEESSLGEMCSLYMNHYGDHKSKHLKKAWK